MQFSNEELALLHGCVMTEIDTVVAQRASMRDGQMVAQSFIYSGKLDRLKAKIEAEINPGNLDFPTIDS